MRSGSVPLSVAIVVVVFVNERKRSAWKTSINPFPVNEEGKKR